MNYIKESNLNGEDIHSKLTKRSKFAIDIYKGCGGFTPKDKGIKTELMKVYTEMTTKFDLRRLSLSEMECKDDAEMNGALFVKHFARAQSFVHQMNDVSKDSKQEWNDLYERIGSFFTPIEER
eukprot:9732_1